jgi:hypothetical protein
MFRRILRYDIYLLQLGFHPVAVVGRLVQKEERDSYLQKEEKFTKQYRSTEYTK